MMPNWLLLPKTSICGEDDPKASIKVSLFKTSAIAISGRCFWRKLNQNVYFLVRPTSSPRYFVSSCKKEIKGPGIEVVINKLATMQYIPNNQFILNHPRFSVHQA